MVLSKTAGSWLSSLGQLMSVLAIFVIVLLLAWLTTRFLAGYQQGQMRNQNLKIIETLRLTANNYIQIIEAGDVYLVIAVSKDHVDKLAEFTKDQLHIDAANTAGQRIDMGESFHDILEKVRHHLPKK